MIRPALRFGLEHIGHQAREEQRSEAPVDEAFVGDRGVQTDVVRVGDVARGDRILHRSRRPRRPPRGERLGHHRTGGAGTARTSSEIDVSSRGRIG
jgi:hypothetical protein